MTSFPWRHLAIMASVSYLRSADSRKIQRQTRIKLINLRCAPCGYFTHLDYVLIYVTPPRSDQTPLDITKYK